METERRGARLVYLDMMSTREFHGFQFDFETGRLGQGDRLIPLEFQPSRVLERLLASPGEVVSRDDLIAVLWGSTTHVKYDDGLNYCIRQVRAALGDDPRSPVSSRPFPVAATGSSLQ